MSQSVVRGCLADGCAGLMLSETAFVSFNRALCFAYPRTRVRALQGLFFQRPEHEVVQQRVFADVHISGLCFTKSRGRGVVL